MAEKDGNLAAAYRGIGERLAASLPGADAGRNARIYVDRALAFYTFDRLGIQPPQKLYDEAGPGVIAEIGHMLENRDPVSTALYLLDDSCSRMASNSRDAGVFYTPRPIADFICGRAIESYLRHRAGHAIDLHLMSLEQLHGLYFNTLKQLRILDSSCGSGIFLESALGILFGLRSRIIEAYKTRFSNAIGPLAEDFKAISHATEYALKKEIIEDNLFGIDIEPYSIEIAAIRLKLLLAECTFGQMDLDDLRLNLSCVNAILGQSAMQGFEVIVGNPPYMRVKSMFAGNSEGARLKKEFAAAIYASGLYQYQEGNFNLYKLFIERNLALLKNGGSMGLIFPATFLNEATSEKLRAHLFKCHAIEEIVEIPERAKLFGRVNQATVILILNQTKAEGNGFTLRIGADLEGICRAEGAILIDFGELDALTGGKMEVPLMADPSIEWEMVRRLRRIPPFCGNTDAAPIGTITVGQADETFDREFITEIPTGDIFVKGIHLKEYAVDLSPQGLQPRWIRKDAFLKKRPSALATIRQPRIIGRNTLNKSCSRRLKFALLPPGYVCSNSIKQILVTDPTMDAHYLLALLNSSTLNWYFELFNDQNNIRNYSVEALPIIRAPAGVQKIFSRLVKLLMSADKETRDYVDKKIIDPLVYELYFTEGRRPFFNAVSKNSDAIEQLLSDPDIEKYRSDIEQSALYGRISRATYKGRRD